MPFEISNSYSNYSNVAPNKEQKIQRTVEKSAENQQKMARSANSTAQAQTYQSVKEYSEYLNSKYSCLKPANGSSVVINPNLLEKAATDEKTAEWLEYNLSLMPDVMDKIYENAAQGVHEL